MTKKSKAKESRNRIPATTYGTVHLKDWIHCPHNGRSYIMVTGAISVYQNKNLVGFEASNRESNWMLRVHGEVDIVTILGCQIRAVTEHQKMATYPVNCWVV